MAGTVRRIAGLRYIPNYLSAHEQDDLIHVIDEQPWLQGARSRIQQYGYSVEAPRRRMPELYLGPLPEWLLPLAARICRDRLIDALPDQVIVSEFQPGQGMAAHIDCRACSGDGMAAISLGGPCVMVFSHTQTHEEFRVLLAPGSLLCLRGDARRFWKHGFRARKFDEFDGHTFPRERRVDVTFRDIIA